MTEVLRSNFQIKEVGHRSSNLPIITQLSEEHTPTHPSPKVWDSLSWGKTGREALKPFANMGEGSLRCLIFPSPCVIWHTFQSRGTRGSLETPYFEYYDLGFEILILCRPPLKGLNLHFQTKSWDGNTRRRIKSVVSDLFNATDDVLAHRN